jgi:hypothetical protein
MADKKSVLHMHVKVFSTVTVEISKDFKLLGFGEVLLTGCY